MKFYCKGDYASMNEILSGKDWQTLFNASNIEENWLMFKNLLYDLADRFISEVKITQSQTGIPWWSNALSKAVEKNIIFIIATFILCLLMTFKYMPNREI